MKLILSAILFLLSLSAFAQPTIKIDQSTTEIKPESKWIYTLKGTYACTSPGVCGFYETTDDGSLKLDASGNPIIAVKKWVLYTWYYGTFPVTVAGSPKATCGAVVQKVLPGNVMNTLQFPGPMKYAGYDGTTLIKADVKGTGTIQVVARLTCVGNVQVTSAPITIVVQ